MSDVVVVVGEIIIGLALLTVVGGAVAVVTTRLLGKASPQEILRERYARGELTREQYEQAQRDIAVPVGLDEGFQRTQLDGRDTEVIASSNKPR